MVRFNQRNVIKNVDKTAAIISLLAFMGSIFFLQSNFTGSAISALNQSTSNVFGSGLFILAVAAGIFAFRHA